MVTVLGWWQEFDFLTHFSPCFKEGRHFLYRNLLIKTANFFSRYIFFSILQQNFLVIRLCCLWVLQQDLSSCDCHWESHCFLKAVPAASPVLTYHVMGNIGLHKSVCLYTYTQVCVWACVCAKIVLQPVMPKTFSLFILFNLLCEIFQIYPLIVREL